MDEALLLTSLAVFTLLAGICSIIFNKAKLPPLIGYLFAGIIITNLWDFGPESEAIVDMLSDMGLVMLMFCIGLEINLKKIRKTGLLAIKVAVVEIPLMALGGVLAGTLLGFTMLQCIVLGALICGSSTATVMAVLKSQGKLDKDHVEMLVLVLIMEDIAQVLILSMITPLLAGSQMSPNDLLVMIVSIVVFMVVSLVIGMKVVPRVINWVSDNVTSEVLVVFSVGLAFGMALLSTYIGLSMAIGAFLMGMMIAASRKSKEINHDIEPMKNLFMAMFFISVGMEVGLDSLADNIGLILILAATFIVLKLLTVFLGYWIANDKARDGFLSAMSLLTMGEFAFIIAKEALDYGVVDSGFYTSVIGAALLTMVLLPILNRYADKMWDKADERLPDSVRSKLRTVNKWRSNMYRRINATSKKSQKALARSMTHAYMNVMMMALIEILFYVGMPLASEWLLDSFGWNRLGWNITLLVLNFLILALPTYHLVINTKYLDEIVIMGAKRITKEGNQDEPGRIYQKYLNINAYLMVATIDSVILFIVPNSLEPLQHLAVFFVAGLIIAFMLYRSNKAMSVPETPSEEETPVQPSQPSEPEPEIQIEELVPFPEPEPPKISDDNLDDIEIFIPDLSRGRNGD